MYREQNKATCRRFIQRVFNEGDLSSIRDFVAPDSIHHDLDEVSAPAGRSPERFAEMVDLYRTGFPDLRVEIQDQVAEDDRVVTCLRMQGTQKGPLLGIGVSGKTVDITGIRIDRLADDRITESWFHWDGLQMLRQIGALPDLARNPQAAPWANDNTFVPTPMPHPTPLPQTEMQRPAAARLRPAA
jgi:steroid delta-isomerase-like uncharacterized protein